VVAPIWLAFWFFASPTVAGIAAVEQLRSAQ
jgi:hypothetical protein